MRASLLCFFVLATVACETSPDSATDAGPSMMGADAGAVGDAGPAGADAGNDAGPSGTDAGPLAMGPTCPPTGPYGMAAGQIADDITLMDCDGVEHSLHSLCENQAVWLFEFADWCPPCRSFAASEVNSIYDRHAGAGFEGYVIISADAGFGAPDAAECEEIRTRYGIHMPVLYDPTGAFQANFGVASNEINIVLSEGAQIEWIGHYAANMVDSRITSTLGR